MLDGSPLLVAIDAEAHDQIVSGGRCGDQSVRCRWRFAPFLGVWRTSKVVSMCARRPRCGSPLCTRCALERRGEAQRFRQCCRATKYVTVREVSGCRRGRERLWGHGPTTQQRGLGMAIDKDLDFTGKTILVTGSGRNIGRARGCQVKCVTFSHLHPLPKQNHKLIEG